MPRPVRALNFPVLLAMAWAATAAVLVLQRWPQMGLRLFDADDAMRLVQVRAFAASHGWFDLHEARLDPPIGYDSHWSRLIDAGLAGLQILFRPFVDAAMAELLMRALWPLLWLLVAMAAVAALAWRIAGRGAAMVTLFLSALALPAFQHFLPGRIDHHNVQIALALSIVAGAVWAERARHAAVLTGALTGLALAVGLESIPFVALAGAGLTLRFALASAGAARALARYGAALAASTLVAFLVGVAPAQWWRPACDAIAINWAAAAIIGGAGLWGVARLAAHRPSAVRWLAPCAVAGVALLVWLGLEPRCVHGPFALTDPAVKRLWLDGVDETESLVAVMRVLPMTAAWYAAFPLVALAVAGALAQDRLTRRDFGFALNAAALALAFALSVAAVKLYAYAMWFAIPLIAAMVSGLTAPTPRLTLALRLAATVVLTPTVITAGAISVARAAGAPAVRAGLADRGACSRNAAYAALAALPPGLVATEVNYGPFVLALTPHSVLAAPYHRLSGGVIAAQALLHGTPEAARALAQRHGVGYVALCGRHASTGLDPPPGSLWAELQAGRAPVWLAAVVDTQDPGVFAVYRVLR